MYVIIDGYRRVEFDWWGFPEDDCPYDYNDCYSVHVAEYDSLTFNPNFGKD